MSRIPEGMVEMACISFECPAPDSRWLRTRGSARGWNCPVCGCRGEEVRSAQREKDDP